MLIGPMLGNAINKAMALPLDTMTDGVMNPDLMTTAYIPAPEIFLAGAVCALLMFALIPFLIKATKKAGENK